MNGLDAAKEQIIKPVRFEYDEYNDLPETIYDTEGFELEKNDLDVLSYKDKM